MTAAVFGGGALAAILTATVLAAVILSGRTRDAGDLEAMVAATKEPPAVACTAPAPAQRPGPGTPPPGPWPHRTPLRKRIDVLACGCTWVWDGRARAWEHVPCSPPPATDWDAEMKGLTQ